jgi:hypothetical protein
VWTATTIAHVATTTAVAIIVKSGIAVDFADFAISHPLISGEGESYSPEMCRIFEKHRHDANRLSPAASRHGEQLRPGREGHGHPAVTAFPEADGAQMKFASKTE